MHPHRHLNTGFLGDGAVGGGYGKVQPCMYVLYCIVLYCNVLYCIVLYVTMGGP